MLLRSCLLLLLQTSLLSLAEGRRCRGTDDQSHFNGDDVTRNEDRYKEMRLRYENCTLVEGNLELVWYPERIYDFGFLKNIEEITGYLLIKQVNAMEIAMPKLRVIRARRAFVDEYGLLISRTKIRRLVLRGLRDVVNGSIGLLDNPYMCNAGSIDWNELVSSGTHGFYQEKGLGSQSCVECDDSCVQGCWASGPEGCQRFSRVVCSGQCWQGRCFGPNPKDCCHPWCAAGCTGPSAAECLECKYFQDGRDCVMECPMFEKLNWRTGGRETIRKYIYGSKCVSQCPSGTFAENGTCVESCPVHKKAEFGECVDCSEGECPKTCKGDWVIHSDNIDSFEGCTTIDGYVNIWDVSFDGFQDMNEGMLGPRHKPMHPSKLEVFRTVKEITGFFHVRASHQEFKNLSYFRNLEVVGGLAIFQTSLFSLGLNSLKKVNADSIKIMENKNLCYADTINWNRIKGPRNKEFLLLYNKKKSVCVAEGSVCHEQCSQEGCWGPGSNQCLSCRNVMQDNHCVKKCKPGSYDDEKTCKPCPPKCGGPCTGPKPPKCTLRSVSLL